MFGDSIDAVKNPFEGGYNLFDIETGNHIGVHNEYTSFDPYKDLQPDQARALEAEYGSAKLVVMEQADTDGVLDKVAVRYEGTKGNFTYEQEYVSIWKTPKAYLTVFIEGNWNELKPLLEQKGYV